MIKKFVNRKNKTTNDRLDNFILASNELLQDPGCIRFFRLVKMIDEMVAIK
jgi:hypothetical protein